MTPHSPSFPRRREPKAPAWKLRARAQLWELWVPASAGMTGWGCARERRSPDIRNAAGDHKSLELETRPPLDPHRRADPGVLGLGAVRQPAAVPGDAAQRPHARL